MKFDSTLEKLYFAHLAILRKTGSIKDFEYHPTPIVTMTPLITHKTKTGEHTKRAKRVYSPDFLLTMPDGELVYIETKGFMREKDKHRMEMATCVLPDTRFWVVMQDKITKHFYVDKEYNNHKLEEK